MPYIDFRLFYQRPGDRESVPLAAGKIRPSLGNLGLVPFFQPIDKIINLSNSGCMADFLHRCVFPAMAEIVQDRAGKQEHLLRHKSNAAPQFLFWHMNDIPAVQEDAAASDMLFLFKSFLGSMVSTDYDYYTTFLGFKIDTDRQVMIWMHRNESEI